MTQTFRTVRIPITVTFYEPETRRQVLTHTSTLKSKIRSLTADAQRQNANCIMECKATYSKDKDSWNKFEFTSLVDFDNKLAPCLEIDMLKELMRDGMLDKKHMEKRKR